MMSKQVQAEQRSKRKVWLSTVAFIVAGYSLVPFAEDARAQTDDLGLSETEDFSGAISDVPRPNISAPSLATQFDLNSAQLSFSGESFLSFGLEGGDDRDPVPDGRLDFVFEEETEQNLIVQQDGNRFDLTQRAWVFQMRSIDRHRTVVRNTVEEGALIGFKLDNSITGKCFLPGTQPDDYCTYTPGIATVPDGVDPDTLVPLAFETSTNFGQVISKEVHDSIQTGNFFQRGEDVPGAPLVGLSFDIPNAGFNSADGSNLSAFGTRDESIVRRPVLSLSSVDQTLSSSSIEAGATRTVRGFVLPDRDEVDTLYALMQLSAWILPSAPSNISVAPGTPVTNVSNNLFLALNNARVPADAFTLFQTGQASLVHPTQTPQSAAETPTAVYHGFWMGLSPVRETRITAQERLTPTGERNSINGPVFAQGGIGTPFEDLVDTGVLLFDEIDNSIESLNVQNIDDLFIQVGLDVSTQEAIRRLTTTETTSYKLVPHFVVGGNRTSGESVFRYYGGLIVNSDTNAYVGADYSLQTESGWGAYSRLDLYSQPDQDYVSEFELRGQRRFELAAQRQLALGVGGVFSLDKSEMQVDDVGRFTILEEDSRIDLTSSLREGNFGFNLRQRFATTDGNDWGNSTTLSVNYADQTNYSLSAQITPISSEGSYVQGSVGLNVRLNDNPDSPVLQAQYSRIRYDLGTTSNGQELEAINNVFRAGISMRF